MSDHTITSPQNIIFTNHDNPTNVVDLAELMLLNARQTQDTSS